MDQRQLSSVIAVTRRRSHDTNLLAIMLEALRNPALVHAKQTKNGLLLVGPGGTTSTHYTNSDPRATANFRSQLRKIGLYPGPSRR